MLFVLGLLFFCSVVGFVWLGFFGFFFFWGGGGLFCGVFLVGVGGGGVKTLI